jgi:hypothetical protein
VYDSAEGCSITNTATESGGCVIAEWDLLGIDDTRVEVTYYVNDPGCAPALHEAQADERADSVTITLLLRYIGGPSVACATSYAARSRVVELTAPLGKRALLGCRDSRRFVPAGGSAGTGSTSPIEDCRATASATTTT